jgi:antagonist of KipI
MLQIVEAGIFTTIQDLGREGYQQFGVTRGGAMDARALRAANALMDNAEGDACIEIASGGLRIRALEKCVVAVAGAPYVLHVQERAVPMNAALFLREGDVLQFDAPAWGRYAYLAISGGVDVPRVLGSRATALRDGFGGWHGRALGSGDIVRAARQALPLERAGKMWSEKFARYYLDDAPLRVLWGPHLSFFDAAAMELFLGAEYHVSELSDRMGTRLLGMALPRRAKELLSCGVTRGAIQIPPDGQPIVLQAEHQTTGGYPVLATVIRADIPRLAQKRAGEAVRFTVTTLADARAAWQAMLEF